MSEALDSGHSDRNRVNNPVSNTEADDRRAWLNERRSSTGWRLSTCKTVTKKMTFFASNALRIDAPIYSLMLLVSSSGDEGVSLKAIHEKSERLS